MNVLYWAALGCRRGEGESPESWLRAGPVGGQAFEMPASASQIDGDLYCPACRIDEAGKRRWYTREDWPPTGVVCTTHALPLLRSVAPPVRLSNRRWPSVLRAEFSALGAWSQQGAGGDVGSAIARAICARSDPRLPHSQAWSAAQWHLWASGWPVPFAPRLSSKGPLAPRFQFDQLALMAIVHRVSLALVSERETGWQALPIRARAFSLLKGRVGRLRLRLAMCFRQNG
jgi:hypothetical protein